ncbi:hypothetical protein GCM10019016_029880 [Streptomyces prasinosporus]|uniref:Restriction endonuclease n=1 Tax=Streptomyces prasinosporus TaxID=68256 RepID=A0ABP6TLM7_9ACTN
MAADSPAHLISLLTRQQPQEILGTPESEWVDFKSVGPEGPYDLSAEKGKFELAKDVAAFANAGGGPIVQDTLRGTQGFNFASAYHRPEAHDGGLLLTQPPRRGLWIESDGAVTAAVAATRDMLGWAMERYSGGADRRISVFVLTEITLECFRLVGQHVLPLVDGSWPHRIVATEFARPPARTLAAGGDPERDA